ncbi:hypothetical protein BRC67_06435 [Halobacteriales archaeon QH_3_68_24]|nr:MAG: hypothetical protein BRC67_06435 [Halobacteriales archaeon QH_3_68_24]
MTPDAGEDGDAPADPDVPPPPVPSDRLDDWERTDATVAQLYGVDGADVRGHTLVYEDRRLRAGVRDATGGALDQSWRFFFATRLGFRPPLAPGVEPTLVPMVRPEAVRRFRADLEDRGVEDVESGRRERVRTEKGKRVHFRQVTGEIPLPGLDQGPDSAAISPAADAVPVEGWVGVWYDEAVLVAGGAYPRTALARTFGVDDERLSLSPSAARDELLALVRAVG